MALLSTMRAPISRRVAEFDTSIRLALPVLWAAFLTLLVAGPWLLPGYLFGTDWPGPRRIPFPTDLSSSAALQATLASVSLGIGSEATGKLIFIAPLFFGAVFAYRAVPVGGFIARAVAATVYVVNPFVYGRLHYGQLFLLLGYAILPWVASRLRTLLTNPGAVDALWAAVSLVLIGIFGLHLALVAMVIAVALTVAYAAAAEQRIAYLKRAVPALLLTAGVSVGASLYWIVPLLTGHGPEGATLAGIGTGDINAFATVSDQRFGLVPNLLGLYGFWAESAGRFDSMKVFAPVWPAILVALLILCGIGAAVVLKSRDQLLAPWVGGLLAAAVVALILEMGVSNPLTSGVVRWLDANFSPYRGMRDAGKWAAVLALAYSQLAALGAVAVLEGIKKRRPGGVHSEWVANIAVGILLSLPLYYGNGLLYGSHGEIRPSEYPAGWYAAGRALTSDPHPGRTLFLPWHEYMAFGFIQNQNKVVAPPGPSFFSVPLVVSLDPELAGVGPPPTPDQIALYDLVREGSQGHWADVLASRHIKYVLLAREVDWQSYKYLDTQPNLVLVRDFGTIALYRNLLIS